MMMGAAMSQVVTARLYLYSTLQVPEVLPEPCYLFRLPPELKLEIMNYIDSKRDLLNISKTCRTLEDVALGRLYSAIDLEVPSDKSYAWNSGDFLKIRSHIAHAVQDLTIRDGLKSARQSYLRDRRCSNAACPESYVTELIQGVPSHRLRSFTLMHRGIPSPKTFQLLKQRHGQSLRHLYCYEMIGDAIIPSSMPERLETLGCRSIENGENLGRLAYINKNTLHTIHLGRERDVVDRYLKLRSQPNEDISQPLQTFTNVISLPEIKNLRCLSLFGLDLTPLVPADMDSALYLTQLHELTMESCRGSAEFLSAMTSIFTYAISPANLSPETVPRLNKFIFRTEVSSTRVRESLVHFLNSFTGLHSLSLLLENCSVFERIRHLIAQHGPTLENLVLESRIQPRESLRLDTSRPFGGGAYSQQLWEEGMNEVCQLCPNLRELGIGFPWNDEMVRIRPSRIYLLKHLRTMHVRNFPESQHLSQMGDYSIKEQATKFMEWTFGSLQGGERPHLETLSIGPGIYESRFKGSNPSREQIPEFLRTHHFMLDWAQTRFGRWSAMITNVSEKFMEEHRDQKPLGGVFEPLWLK